MKDGASSVTQPNQIVPFFSCCLTQQTYNYYFLSVIMRQLPLCRQHQGQKPVSI